MTDYFAYGSNMSVTQMARRCPQACLSGNATLAGYDFLINRKGHATIIARTELTVWGLLWTLSDADIRSLDDYEEIALGHYVKEYQAVVCKGQQVMALVYVATDATPGMPEQTYLQGILDAAAARDLPADYVQKLASWHPALPNTRHTR